MFRQLATLTSRAAARNVGSKLYASSLVTKFDTSVDALPRREAVRYTGKNLKWTAKEFQEQTESHANALLEHGFQAGDTIALWLPESAEKHVTLIAAAKAGLKVVDIDTSITDVEDVRKSLNLSQAKAIYFKPVHGEVDYLKTLRKAIPEFFDYDDSNGQLFHSKYFPTLKYFIHLGFDNEVGCLNYKELFLRHPPISYVAAVSSTLSDDTPLYSTIVKGSKGVEKGTTVSQGKALDVPTYSFAKKIINNEYFETA